MLTCQELVELITDYLEDAMPVEVRSRFESHISACHGCEGYLEQVRQTVRLSGALGEHTLDTTVRDKLLTAFRDWKATGPTR